MNISPVSCNSRLALCSAKKNSTTTNNNEYMEVAKMKVPYTPATIGVMNAALWTGIGLAFDKTFSLITRTDRKFKSSLILNSLIGAGMGTYAYFSAKKDFKAKNAG